MSEYRWQTALRLHERGLSYKEIGVTMGVAENTVAVMLRRARKDAETERLTAENAQLRERIRILELTDE